MNNILLISQTFYPDEVSTANLFTLLCKQLSTEGLNVEVWAAQPSYTNTKKQFRKQSIDSIRIIYMPTSRFSNTKLAGRFLNTFTFAACTTIKLIFNRNKYPVFTHTTPPGIGFIVSLICKIKKRQSVFILLDLLPEGLIRLEKVSRNNIFIKIWDKAFRKTLHRFSKLVVLGRDMSDIIRDKYHIKSSKIKYIPLWQDEKHLIPVEYGENHFYNTHNPDNNFIVQYSGNMGLWSEMTTIGKVAGKGIDGVRFMFIGGGIRKPELLKEIPKEAEKDILLLPFQPGNILNQVLSACHISLVSMKDGLEGMAVPSKIYGMLAAGRAIIAIVPEKSEISKIINEEECGLRIDPGDRKALEESIILLKNNASLRLKMGQNALVAFQKKYTIKSLAKRYIDVYSEL